MMDWAEGIETRNYGIRRRTDLSFLAELLSIIFALLVMAGVSVSQLWQRSQIVDMGYETQRLRVLEESLLRTEKSLILEEETLKDPERIDRIARQILGMAPLRAHQVLPPAPLGEERDGSPALLAEAPQPSAGPRKFSAAN